jgi:hypothetical protein
LIRSRIAGNGTRAEAVGVSVGFTQFLWEGEPILDIEQWAADHGFPMMVLTVRVKDYNVYAGTITSHLEVMEMPEPFTFQGFTDDRMIVSCVRRDPA